MFTTCIVAIIQTVPETPFKIVGHIIQQDMQTMNTSIFGVFIITLIMLNLTNGVSFSLVAGAVCYINFTAGYTSTYTCSTLNINSTGAKTFKNDSTIGSINNSSETSKYVPTLVCYTGSEYLYATARRNITAHYNDSDS